MLEQFRRHLHLATSKLLSELLDALLSEANTLTTTQLLQHVANTLRHGSMPGTEAILAVGAGAHVALGVPADRRLLGTECLLNGLIELLLADDEVAGVGVQVVQAGLAGSLVAGHFAVEGAAAGLHVLLLDRERTGEEATHTRVDGRLGEDVDFAPWRHGELGALRTALLDVCEMCGICGYLARVQLLDTLAERFFADLSQALLVQAQLGVAAVGTGLLAFLCIACRAGQELRRVLRLRVARLEDVAGDGQVTLAVGRERKCRLPGLVDVDVVGRLRTHGFCGGRSREGTPGRQAAGAGDADGHAGRHGGGCGRGDGRCNRSARYCWRKLRRSEKVGSRAGRHLQSRLANLDSETTLFMICRILGRKLLASFSSRC